MLALPLVSVVSLEMGSLLFLLGYLEDDPAVAVKVAAVSTVLEDSTMY